MRKIKKRIAEWLIKKYDPEYPKDKSFWEGGEVIYRLQLEDLQGVIDQMNSYRENENIILEDYEIDWIAGKIGFDWMEELELLVEMAVERR